MLVEDSHSRVMHGSLRLLLTYCTSWGSASKLTTAGFAKWARFKKLSGSTQISVLEDITFNVHFRRESKSAQSNIKLCELKSAYGFYTLAAVEWASCPSICQTGLRHPYRRRISQEYRKNREWFTIHRHIDGLHTTTSPELHSRTWTDFPDVKFDSKTLESMSTKPSSFFS